MNRFRVVITLPLALLLLISVGVALGGKTIKPGETQISVEADKTNTSPEASELNTKAGEQVVRQVVSPGGNHTSSASYHFNGTLCQISIGGASSSGYNVNAGMWQVLSTASPCWPPGNADGLAEVDIDDVVFLISYIFSGGPPPDPLCCGDANGSGNVDIDDVMYLIAYIFSGGPSPVDAC